MGENTFPIMEKLLKDTDRDVKEFAILAVYEYKFRRFIPALINALTDPEFRIAQSAVRGLGELEVKEAADTLMYFLENPREGLRQDLLLSALSKIGCVRIMPYLEKN